MFDVTPAPEALSFDAEPHRVRVGDHVKLRHDVLAEIAQPVGQPATWFCVPTGTEGQVVGWRDVESSARAIIEVDGTDHQLVVFVGADHVATCPRRPVPAIRLRRVTTNPARVPARSWVRRRRHRG